MVGKWLQVVVPQDGGGPDVGVDESKGFESEEGCAGYAD